jgi:hypothetical protein
MIIVKLIGGLGNQMFQYAAARGLAHRNSTFMKLDLYGFETYKIRKYQLHCFNIVEQFATISEINAFITNSSAKKSVKRQLRFFFGINQTESFYYPSTSIIEKNLCFSEDAFNQKGHIYLDGYWQSDKYFADIKEVIYRDFSFRIKPSTSNQRILNQINNSNSISVHIRRGDYINNADFNLVHGTCPSEYYQNAISLINDKVHNPTFFFFSDDLHWVKQNITINQPHVYVDINDEDSSFEDLRLMSNCKHHIISNSSFSWWGAWLNQNPDKIVIAPRNWFANNELNGQSIDIVPEGWIRL